MQHPVHGSMHEHGLTRGRYGKESLLVYHKQYIQADIILNYMFSCGLPGACLHWNSQHMPFWLRLRKVHSPDFAKDMLLEVYNQKCSILRMAHIYVIKYTPICIERDRDMCVLLSENNQKYVNIKSNFWVAWNLQICILTHSMRQISIYYHIWLKHSFAAK